MTEKQERLQNRLLPEMCEFRDQCKTLQLATLNKGKPHTSYAPFAYNELGYYILVSNIAQHGKNLEEEKSLSVMMIEDESSAKTIYARRRLSFDTEAVYVDKTSTIGLNAIQTLKERFGDFVVGLSQLGDFHLYQLTPEKGRYVKGFGKAFDFVGKDMLDIVHLSPGHLSVKKDN